LTANQALVGSNIILTASAEIKSVTICGATLGSTPVVNALGVSMTTNRDDTLTCSATGTVGVALGSITAVSMTFPIANRVAGEAQSAVFDFTTSVVKHCRPARLGSLPSSKLMTLSGIDRKVGSAAYADIISSRSLKQKVSLVAACSKAGTVCSETTLITPFEVLALLPLLPAVQICAAKQV
jgi:hypothetical protein